MLKPCRNGLVWGSFHLPVSWALLHWDAEMLSNPMGELFIYLFNFIILAQWRYDWRWSNIPTQVDAASAHSCLCVCVCLLIKRPHTSECGSLCEFIGAPKALDAYISPYQRTLIAPSMSEQIDVHTSVHKASSLTLGALALLFVFFHYSQEFHCALRESHRHICCISCAHMMALMWFNH